MKVFCPPADSVKKSGLVLGRICKGGIHNNKPFPNHLVFFGTRKSNFLCGLITFTSCIRLVLSVTAVHGDLTFQKTRTRFRKGIEPRWEL